MYLYTRTTERKADKEESKTNTPEIWFSAGRKMTVDAALEETGCDDESARNVKTFTQS